ncbi:MAG TPA: class I SAM-dependent methyltransferase [Planctomycetaceae bacterium]|nr:class I SAM-dependent methyltransferase [Planctomycetaceae bacterium]
MSNIPTKEEFRSMYAGKAPWDIGRPQRMFVDAADLVRGDVFDAGCGTGEHALLVNARGHAVVGIDFLEFPIQEARRRYSSFRSASKRRPSRR